MDTAGELDVLASLQLGKVAVNRQMGSISQASGKVCSSLLAYISFESCVTQHHLFKA